MSALKHKGTAVLTANRVKIIEKIRESAISVLPIVVIVLVLCLTIAPVGTDLLLCFLIGTIFENCDNAQASLVVYSANQKGSSVADKCPGRTPFAFCFEHKNALCQPSETCFFSVFS